jgi:nitrogen-specific signal transduction histidine kinase
MTGQCLRLGISSLSCLSFALRFFRDVRRATRKHPPCPAAQMCVKPRNSKGIPVEVRSRIFDPFFTTKEVGRGTGQGLAIARNVVVDKHGGTLHFETETGKGTTFYIRLPVAGPASASAAA